VDRKVATERERPVLTGQSEHAVDEKGRVIIPPKFREFLGKSFVLTLGFEGCLIAYPTDRFQIVSSELSELSYLKENVRKLQRLMLYGAELCELDKQGRLLIPQTHREHAQIRKEVVLVGVIDKLEIWAKEKWLEFLAQSKPSYEKLAEELGEIKL
jgi:MraZ protein